MFLLQQLISGLEAGAGYGLVGLAIVIVMKSTDVPNFAAAEIGLVGAYVLWTLTTAASGPQMPFLPALVLSLLLCAAIGTLVQILFVRPFTGLSPAPLAIGAALCAGLAACHYMLSRAGDAPAGAGLWLAAMLVAAVVATLVFLLVRHGIPATIKVDHFALLLMTMGLVYVLMAMIHKFWGSEPRALRTPWTGARFDLFGLSVGYGQIITIVTAFVVAMAVGIFFKSTWGVRMRAIAEDGNNARLQGINSSRISMLAWAMAGAISGIAMVLKTSQTLLDPGSGDSLILLGFIAATLGGFTSLGGTFIGGLVVGLGEALAGGFIDTRIQPTVALLVVVIVLLVSPGGLTREKKRRQV